MHQNLEFKETVKKKVGFLYSGWEILSSSSIEKSAMQELFCYLMTFNCPPKNLPNPISSQAYFLNINALQGRVLLLFFWGLKFSDERE